MSHSIWSIVLLAGLAGWITFTTIMIFKAFPERDIFVPKEALKWGTCVIICLVVWIAGLLNA
jgi:hypothetical protein